MWLQMGILKKIAPPEINYVEIPSRELRYPSLMGLPQDLAMILMVFPLSFGPKSGFSCAK